MTPPVLCVGKHPPSHTLTHIHFLKKAPCSALRACVYELACCYSGALGPALDWLSSDVSDAARALISEMHSQLLIFIGNQMFTGGN